MTISQGCKTPLAKPNPALNNADLDFDCLSFDPNGLVPLVKPMVGKPDGAFNTNVIQSNDRLAENLSAMNLLLVEDDLVLGKAISRGLTEAGHECHWERNGRRGLEQATSQQFEAVILDLMLPDLSGQEVLASIRSQGVRVPVLVLTAMSSVEDRVQGLKAGADDYLVKPFAFAELVARLEAICRRSTDRPASQLQVGSLTLNLTNRRVTRGDVELILTPTEFSLLEFLMRYDGQVVTRKMLCEHLWDSDWEGVTNVIEVHINRLRGKIDRGQSDPMIHTVRGRGYVLRAV